MEKSLFSKDYAVFLDHLRAVREKAGLTQAQVGAKLKQTQSFVSKCERGERRIDIVELRAFCCALAVKLVDFTASFEKALARRHKRV